VVNSYDRSYDNALHSGLPKVAEAYVGFVEGLPGANTQGATLEEARENQAVNLVLEADRSLIDADIKRAEVIRESLDLPT
jgi:predicted RNase H-like HicB family nuclease